MTEKNTAKIFMHGRSQAVRLPKQFRLPGKEVRVRKVGNAVLLEPLEKKSDAKAWLTRVQALAGPDFLPEGRPEQPTWRKDDDISFD